MSKFRVKKHNHAFSAYQFTECDSDTDDENEIETYVDVSGRKTEKDKNALTDSYAIEFVEWKKWLGMAPSNRVNE